MSTRDIERLGNTSPLEYRSTAAGKPAIIQGFAAVFNSPSQPLGNQGVVETVASSLFNKQKGDNDFRNVIAKYDHRSDFLLGSKAARNLELEIHAGGLWYAVHINTETRSGADVYEWVKSKIVTGSSFSFVAYDDRWDWKNGRPERTLLSGKTNDLGPTSTPAYEASSVSALRSLARTMDAPLDEIQFDYQNGTLERYFVRTDNRGSIPTPLDVAQRSHDAAGSDIDFQRRRLELHAKRIQMGTGHRPDEPRQLSTEQRLLELRRRRTLWDQPLRHGA